MNDMELLVVAAKAAGVTHPEVLRKHIEGGWNPLTDDGDALRLAVKLDLTLARIRTMSGPHRVAQTGRSVIESEPEGDDPCAAMRRAIVRAAAEIGKQSNAALSSGGTTEQQEQTAGTPPSA